MRIYLTAGLLLGLLAGCSADQGTSADKAAVAASDVLQQKTAMLPFAMRHVGSSFASLPDRGELLAYDSVRSVKHSGAYTAYPVALSEAHALDAMRTGQMVIKAPNGELIRLKYERHVEHPDGNWTWIGRNAEGADALITFGDKAVFGTIPQGASDTLRLTMSADHAFLVTTDRSKLAGLDGSVRRSGTDQLIPPKLVPAASGRMTASMQPQSVGVQPAAAASSVVDVLLGYTQGFVDSFSSRGGESAAITRLVNMVDITNQAYANSGVSMRVRLVGTLKVPNYPDNTDNGDALEKLTGYKSGSGGGPIATDPAFNALRAKRDELGADLVSLVRAFRTPENDGCGIAWLIGGNKTGIETSDEAFGYSVVSDGTDKDEGDGKTYYCRDETLAHELGHNMGQAHNTEDSNSPGVHDYSYGYRETTTGGFYTVMAYPKKDANQYAIRYFANPSVKDSATNRVTGVANQSDNVRSMNITMPVVSGFRATVIPIGASTPTDVNGNGKSDFLWQNTGAKQFGYWLMDGSSTVGSKTFSNISTGYVVVASGDFDGDGRADVVWDNPALRQPYIWFAKADGSFSSSAIPAYPAGWSIVGTGDVDADGRADIFWQNAGTKQFAYWRMNGASLVGSKTYSNIASGYVVVAIGDFNSDGRADVLWDNPSLRQPYVWLAKSDGNFTSAAISAYPAGWSVVGAGDVDADGRADILWQNIGAKQFGYWRMNGATILGSKIFSNIASGYVVAAAGDYNGDGRADVLWDNPSQRMLYVWFSQSSGAYVSGFAGSYPSGWKLVP